MEILGLVNIPLWLITLSLTFFLTYLYGTWNYGTWTALGVAGPKPRAFIGNMADFKSKGMIKAVKDWREQYGRVFGLYGFTKPVLMVADLSFLKEVMVRQFRNFSDRSVLGEELMHDFIKKTLFFSKGEPWHRYRSLMSPAFSTGKLKALLGYMDKCAQALTTVMEKMVDNDEEISLKETYELMTLDVIAGTEFGLQTDMLISNGQKQKDLLWAIKELVASSALDDPRRALPEIFPPFVAFFRWMGMEFFSRKSIDFFKSFISGLVRERDANLVEAKKRVDLLQLLLNSKNEESTSVSGNQLYLTEEEVASQCVIIFLAGFETTANTLRFLTYSMATNPQAQDKLYDEIMDVIGDGEVTYDKLTQMKYLDMIVYETLRMFPPLPLCALYGSPRHTPCSLSRHTLRETTIHGVTIPKDSIIFLPIYDITHDPENYKDPELFHPERFAEDEDTFLKVLPFGFGPRQCIGLRLALLEIKVAVVHLFRKLKVVPSTTSGNDKISFTNNGLLAPEKPIMIKAMRR